MLRYQRQSILRQIGNEGQKKLLNSKVCLVGAGGLGHPVAQYLAAMGIGQIKIVDGDNIHITNLHRQILFSEHDLGRNKAEVLAQKIGNMNRDMKISYEPFFLDKLMALKYFCEFDLIIDCTDNFESKFLINDVCALYDKPMIYGAISQFEGQVGIFWKSKGACYRCLYPSIPSSKIQNCAEAGVIGPVVGTIGALQAMEAMKVLVNNDDMLNPLVGKINFFDFCDHSLRSLEVSTRVTCPCHSSGFSENKILELQRPACSFSSTAIIVDVREVDEWDEYHIHGSFNFPLSQLELDNIPNFEIDQEIVLICKAGVRAQRAQEILTKMNFKNVYCTDRSVYEYQNS